MADSKPYTSVSTPDLIVCDNALRVAVATPLTNVNLLISSNLLSVGVNLSIASASASSATSPAVLRLAAFTKFLFSALSLPSVLPAILASVNKAAAISLLVTPYLPSMLVISSKLSSDILLVMFNNLSLTRSFACNGEVKDFKVTLSPITSGLSTNFNLPSFIPAIISDTAAVVLSNISKLIVGSTKSSSISRFLKKPFASSDSLITLESMPLILPFLEPVL